MRSTVLSIVTQFCNEAGLPAPSALVGATGATSINLLALLRKVLRECQQYKFPLQHKRITWVSTAGEDQGLLSTVFGADYRSIVPNTFWDETLRRPIYGPTPDSEWEAFKSLNNPGPFYRYAFLAGRIRILPAMAAGHTLAVTLYDQYPVVTAVTLVTKPDITADNDTLVYDDDITISGLDWCWRKAKGEDWQDDRALWMNMVIRALGRDGGPVFDLSARATNAQPGILVPSGNWLGQ